MGSMQSVESQDWQMHTCSQVHSGQRLPTSTALGTCVALIYFIQPAPPRKLSLGALGQAAGPASGIVGKGTITKGNNSLFVGHDPVAQHGQCTQFANVRAPTQGLVFAGSEVIGQKLIALQPT